MKKIRFLFLFVLLTACSSAPAPVEPPQEVAPAPAFTSNPTAKIPPTPISTLESTPVAVETGKIAFTSDVDGVTRIYVVNMDGSGLFELAADIFPTFNPAWSPDGQRISFSSNDEKSGSLYLVNADGTNMERVLETKDFGLYDLSDPDIRFSPPCCSSIWSPDGGKISFQASYHNGCCASIGNIYILNLDDKTIYTIKTASWSSFFWSPDGTRFGLDGMGRCGNLGFCVFDAGTGEVIPITSRVVVRFGGPSWSPDGNKIAFVSNRESNNSDVYVMNADGSNPVNVSKEITGHNADFAWSSDSKHIAFVSYNFEVGELYVASLEDGNLINLTQQLGGYIYRIAWMPDSNRIIFEADGDGNLDIYMAKIDGTGLVNLTKHPGDDGGAVLSPDAAEIAFESDRDGDSDIYILDLATMNLFNLTNNDVNDYSPVWQP